MMPNPWPPKNPTMRHKPSMQRTTRRTTNTAPQQRTFLSQTTENAAPKCCACHKNYRKLPRISWKRRRSIAPATQNDFRRVTEHVLMSQSATPATRNEATKRWKPPKMTPPAELTIGTAIRSSRGRLRTVANGCGRERNVERTHPQPPDSQSETGTLATHSGKHETGMKSWIKVPVAWSFAQLLKWHWQRLHCSRAKLRKDRWIQRR